ncbi:MAG: YoaP domain-containing protein [Flavobacteriaceae bacterium]|nr:YoaP domain-containing protein [Flavobacteriaceae bacterium]
METTEHINLIEVNPLNVEDYGVFCAKNKKAPGYAEKVKWMRQKLNSGVKLIILADAQGKQLGFVEYSPAESCWRAVDAPGYLFVQCIYVARKSSRDQNLASKLLQAIENDARTSKKLGVCTLTSDGPWMANKTLFEKNGFVQADTRGRFELLYKPFEIESPSPSFFDWTESLKEHQGWHLLYADQCPWHEKSVSAISDVAREEGVPLQVTHLNKPEEAQKGPSGFGTFALIKDGKLLADHYLSATRFKNILKKEFVG